MKEKINEHSRVLLTGGTGFFGKALLRYWAHQEQLGIPNPNVTIISREPERFSFHNLSLASPSWLEMIKGDICDLATLPSGLSFTHVLHAAADSTLGPSLSPKERFDQALSGTRNVLELSVACGATRFLLTSSGGAYGTQPACMQAISETYNGMPDPLNPANAYSVAKRQTEHLCALYGHQYGIETVVARCFAFVGEDLPRDAHFAIGNFIRDALERPEIVVNGNGSPIRSYMHQNDLAHWLLELLQHGKAGNAYNVGSDEAISIAELACLVRDILSPQKQVQVKGEAFADNVNRSRYIPDISKAQNELGLKVTLPLADAIRMSVPR
jgi:UDP-glucuronate decarboxylase